MADKEADQKRDEVLKRLLKTPPQPKSAGTKQQLPAEGSASSARGEDGNHERKDS